MFSAYPKIVALIATTLLLRVPFLTLKQIVKLSNGLLPAELDDSRRVEWLRKLLKGLIKSGLLQVLTKVTVVPTPMLVGNQPIHVWRRDAPPLTPEELDEKFQELKSKHRHRLPDKDTGKYTNLNLYFATTKTPELADGITAVIDSQILRERLEQEEREKRNHANAGRLHLDHFDPKEFQEFFADFFINCHFNMAWAYLETLNSNPSQAKSWRPCIVRPSAKIDDYPHAVRTTELGDTAMFFGGGLGPVVTQMIHDKLACSFAGYEDW